MYLKQRELEAPIYWASTTSTHNMSLIHMWHKVWFVFDNLYHLSDISYLDLRYSAYEPDTTLKMKDYRRQETWGGTRLPLFWVPRFPTVSAGRGNFAMCESGCTYTQLRLHSSSIIGQTSEHSGNSGKLINNGSSWLSSSSRRIALGLHPYDSRGQTMGFIRTEGINEGCVTCQHGKWMRIHTSDWADGRASQRIQRPRTCGNWRAQQWLRKSGTSRQRQSTRFLR